MAAFPTRLHRTADNRRTAATPMMAVQTTMTHQGTAESGSTRPSASATANTPMNRWPSLCPWPDAMRAADSTCSLPKTRRARLRCHRRHPWGIKVIRLMAPRNPSTVEKKRPITNLLQASHSLTAGPAVARPAPARPARRRSYHYLRGDPWPTRNETLKTQSPSARRWAGQRETAVTAPLRGRIRGTPLASRRV